MGKRQQKVEQKKALKKLAEDSKDTVLVISPPRQTKSGAELVEHNEQLGHLSSEDRKPGTCKFLADPKQHALCEAAKQCTNCDSVREMLAEEAAKVTAEHAQLEIDQNGMTKEETAVKDKEAEKRQRELKTELKGFSDEVAENRAVLAQLEESIQKERKVQTIPSISAHDLKNHPTSHYNLLTHREHTSNTYITLNNHLRKSISRPRHPMLAKLASYFLGSTEATSNMDQQRFSTQSNTDSTTNATNTTRPTPNPHVSTSRQPVWPAAQNQETASLALPSRPDFESPGPERIVLKPERTIFEDDEPELAPPDPELKAAIDKTKARTDALFTQTLTTSSTAATSGSSSVPQASGVPLERGESSQMAASRTHESDASTTNPGLFGEFEPEAWNVLKYFASVHGMTIKELVNHMISLHEALKVEEYKIQADALQDMRILSRRLISSPELKSTLEVTERHLRTSLDGQWPIWTKPVHAEGSINIEASRFQCRLGRHKVSDLDLFRRIMKFYRFLCENQQVRNEPQSELVKIIVNQRFEVERALEETTDCREEIKDCEKKIDGYVKEVNDLSSRLEKADKQHEEDVKRINVQNASLAAFRAAATEQMKHQYERYIKEIGAYKIGLETEKKQCVDLRAQLQSCQQLLNIQKTEKDELVKKHAEALVEAAETAEKLRCVNEHLDFLEIEGEEARDNITRLTVEKGTLESQYQESARKLENYKYQIRNFDDQMHHLRGALGEDLRKVEAELRKTKNEVDKLTAENEKLSNAIKERNDVIDTRQETIKAQKELIQKLQTDKATLQAALDDYTRDASTSYVDVSALTEELAEANEKLLEAEKTVKKLEQQLEEHKASLARRRGVDLDQRDRDALEEINANLKREIEEGKKELEKIKLQKEKAARKGKGIKFDFSAVDEDPASVRQHRRRHTGIGKFQPEFESFTTDRAPDLRWGDETDAGDAMPGESQLLAVANPPQQDPFPSLPAPGRQDENDKIREKKTLAANTYASAAAKPTKGHFVQPVRRVPKPPGPAEESSAVPGADFTGAESAIHGRPARAFKHQLKAAVREHNTRR
ncbi:hypothetical protein M011DRAFT_478413 [Sporormia fimetaria CBS 119925]|uniref:Uncharacterized protein n=1 Tax=Sporormia fimetaria CBS 119925 TaxID=1340428 RepID=A0A6A6V9Q7_9PLEO|nr:hypothetical protein M011DRAFT_478413 [Sporormia fimetaria CBS 119925]